MDYNQPVQAYAAIKEEYQFNSHIIIVEFSYYCSFSYQNTIQKLRTKSESFRYFNIYTQSSSCILAMNQMQTNI